MSPFLLLGGLAFWGVAFVCHVCLWRVRRPVDDLRALLVLFTVLPMVLAGAAVCLGWPVTETGLALLLALALGAGYVFWYPAAQAASPTMLICVTIGDAGGAGCEPHDLRAAVCPDLLTRETFNNLFAERFATLEPGERVSLTSRGRRTLRLIQIFRRLAGFDEPKG
jgi:hypothetical protein